MGAEDEGQRVEGRGAEQGPWPAPPGGGVDLDSAWDPGLGRISGHFWIPSSPHALAGQVASGTIQGGSHQVPGIPGTTGTSIFHCLHYGVSSVLMAPGPASPEV